MLIFTRGGGQWLEFQTGLPLAIPQRPGRHDKPIAFLLALMSK